MLWSEEHKERLVLWITPLIKSFRSAAPDLIGSQSFFDYQSFAAPPTKSFSTTEEVKSHYCFITFNIFSCSSVSAVGENFMSDFLSERYEGKTTTKQITPSTIKKQGVLRNVLLNESRHFSIKTTIRDI